MDEKKFNMKVTFITEEITPTGTKPFAQTTTEYSELSQQGVSMIEHAGLNMLGALRNYGDEQIGLVKKAG